MSEIMLGTTPDQSLSMFHTTSLATLGILGLSQFKKSSRQLPLAKYHIPIEKLPSRKLFGNLQDDLDSAIEQITDSYTNPDFKKNLIILHGPQGTGKSTFMHLLPKELSKFFDQSQQNVAVQYYSIPLSDLQKGEYAVVIAQKLGGAVDEIVKMGLDQNIYPIMSLDEASGVLQRAEGKDGRAFALINDAVKQAIQPGKKALFIMAVNDINAIDPAIRDRALVVETKMLGEGQLRGFLEHSLVSAANTPYQENIAGLLKADPTALDALHAALIKKNSLASGRSINDACSEVVSRHLRILNGSEKTTAFKESPDDSKEAFKKNSLRISIEAFATSKDEYAAISSKIDEKMLQDTKDALKSHGALFKAPDTDFTTAHHVAFLLKAHGVDADKIGNILKNTQPKDFSEVIEIFATKRSSLGDGAIDNKISDEELFAHALVSPWKLVQAEESPLDSRTSYLPHTIDVVAKTENIEKSEIGKNPDTVNVLAQAPKKHVVEFSSEFKKSNTKHDAHFKKAYDGFIKQRPAPYFTAVGTGIPMKSISPSNMGNSGKAEQLN